MTCQHFDYVVSLPPDFHIAGEKLDVNLIENSLHVICLLSAFRILWVLTLLMMCLGVYLYGLVLVVVHYASWMCRLIIFIKF